MAAKSSKPNVLSGTPPFRATQLWNEAVSILQNCMPTRRHFYRMRYYDKCFSGKEAIEWLYQALRDNPRFGKNVTIEGIRKLLEHFLRSGVFQSVKGNLTFKDGGLYEFVNQTITSPSRKQECRRLLPQKCPKEVDPNVPQGDVRNSKVAMKRQQLTASKKPCNFLYSDGDAWKEFILNRIETLLPTLGLQMLLDPENICSDWVKINVCPRYQSMRNNTELPFSVFTAIMSVIRPHEKESEYTTYLGFEKDVYKVVRDYLRHRSCPVIPYCLYELVMYTFSHLHYADLQMKSRLKERDDVVNVVLSMSNEWSDQQLVSNEDLSTTMLPPNTCFETAFTSDEPVTRIVPQSCVDTICLNSRKSLSDQSKALDSRNNQLQQPLRSIKMNSGICNKFRRKRNGGLRRTQSLAHIDLQWNPPPIVEHQSYVNYGLSQSMDELLVEDSIEGSLDLEEAMRSVHSLLRATTVSASFDSLTTVDSCTIDSADLYCIDSCQWTEQIQGIACSTFHFMLMLMPPVSRTSLRMLLQFIDRLCVPPQSTITKTEIVYDLSAHILSPGPQSNNVYSHHEVLSVVYFLVDNCQYLFQEIHPTDLLKKDMEGMESKENQQPQVYCEQVTGAQFLDQGVTSSWMALAELLDQILSDTKMKTKEKKKRLKKFKEAYPHIYRERLGSSSSKSLLQFR